MIAYMTTWYERVRERRAQMGLSVAEMAERTGLSRAAIMNMEEGRVTSPRYETLLTLGKVIGMTPDEIFGIGQNSKQEQEDDYEAFVRRHLPNTPAPMARTFMENFDKLEGEAQEEVLRLLRLLDRAGGNRPKPRRGRGRGKAGKPVEDGMAM